MMKHAPIARKVSSAFAVLVAVSLIVATFTLVQTFRLDEGIGESEKSQHALRAVESYRGALLGMRKTMLKLVATSNTRYLDTMNAAMARHGRERAALGERLADDGNAMTLIAGIDGLVLDWQREVVAAQLRDLQDPGTADLARLRESQPENRRRWETIDGLFVRLTDLQEARMAEASERQKAQLVMMRVATGGSALVILAMCAAMALLTHRSVAAPLHRLAIMTERLKDRDWSVEITGRDRRDEIGRMARALEVFRDTGRSQEALEERQKADAEARLKAAEDVREAVARFRDAASGLLGELGGAGSSLDAAAAALGDVVGTSQTYTRTVSEAASATGESVQNVAAAIEEMSLSIRDVSGQLQQMSGLAQRSADASAVAGEKVSGLKERSEKIHDVVDLINGIAGQINLLALNATIESARAGEAGKGFAVVAQQVKQLADETGRATEDIARVVDEVQADVAAVVEAIGTIDCAIAEVNSSSSTVAAAVEEQSTALDEISRNVSNVSGQTSEVAGNVKGVETKVEETREVAVDVRRLSDTLRTSSTRLGDTIEDFIGQVANEEGRPAEAG